jgi:hypothetical protein
MPKGFNPGVPAFELFDQARSAMGTCMQRRQPCTSKL